MTYSRFFVYKNRNIKVVILAPEAFLLYILLAAFILFIANAKAVVAGMSS